MCAESGAEALAGLCGGAAVRGQELSGAGEERVTRALGQRCPEWQGPCREAGELLRKQGAETQGAQSSKDKRRWYSGQVLLWESGTIVPPPRAQCLGNHDFSL